jgi:molybdopterin-dependent oxidoreductase alpha subunit
MSDPSDEAAAGGLASIAQTARHVLSAGLSRALPALRRVNQPDGFDCPGCAWPEDEGHGAIEFCENGAKAVAHEATSRTLSRELLLSWPVSLLREQPQRWLEAQGRLAEPLWLRPGSDHFEPISWSAAFARTGEALRALASPDQAVFYTSGRTSNEAAFLYQLFVRAYGTNNLPDCSNLCHESSGTGLTEMIGIGKGTVSLADFAQADLILVIGQNPGSNHPRMLTTLQAAARRGCHIVSVNPLRERGLVRFGHPQELAGLFGSGTKLAERFVRVRVGGDIALLKGVMKELLALEAERGGVLDRAFLDQHTLGFEAFAEALSAHSFEGLEAGSGISRREMRELAELYASSQRTIACWAMGLTQHRHGVGNVQELMNLLLLRGNIGRPGAGPCPVRGHSNVQGDRTMGIWERPPAPFLDALEREFDTKMPRRPGLSTIEAITAMAEGRAQVFVGLGGNFAVASPDTSQVEAALAAQTLTVHVATKLNRTHLLGREVLLLPCLGRTERDVQRSGPQFVTVEDSMARVHRSEGRLPPVSAGLASEPAIVAGIARATLGERSSVPWEELAADYDRIREHIARVVPGCEDMNTRVRAPGGFTLPRPPAERRFETPSGRAELREVALPEIEVAPGRLLLMTLRSHDQYNTTIYSDDDRYRGVFGDRRIVFVHPEDLRALGLASGALVDVTSHCPGPRGEETRALRGFRTRAYDVPRGCAAAYFPEANALVPLSHHAEGSLTPAYKSVVVSLAACG